MIHRRVVTFLILSIFFALVHLFAVEASLYWYYWWFDIFMHFWGGILIGVGVHALATFTHWKHVITYRHILLSLLGITVTWEIFEYYAGLYDPATYLFDTAKDLLVGFSGGLLAHTILRRYTMK